MAVAFKAPFETIYLKEDSQRILVYIASVVDPIEIKAIQTELGMDQIRVQDALTELENHKPSKYITIDQKGFVSLNLTENELLVMKFLNLNIDVIAGTTFDNEFTCSIVQDNFKRFLEENLIFQSDDAIYKVLRRAFEKLVNFRFLSKTKRDKAIWFKLNVDFFYLTSPNIKIIRYLHQSISELRSNVKPGKIKNLSLHNLYLHFLDINNTKIDFALLDQMVTSNAEKDFIKDSRIKNEPFIYNEETKYGQFSIRVFQGKKSGHPSIEIIISQDKIKHAIPLTQLPFLLGYIDYFLNKEKRFYFKDLELRKCNVSMIHYNFDFKLKDNAKKQLYEREIAKELTLGQYHDHFLFRFYQLSDDEYRFESQISKSVNSGEVKVGDIIDENEGNTIFKTIRGLMKQSVDVVNKEIDTELINKKILDATESNSKKLTGIYHLNRDMNSNFMRVENEVNKGRINTEKSISKVDVDLQTMTFNMDGLTKTLESFGVEQQVLHIDIKRFLKQDGKNQDSINENFKLTMTNFNILAQSMNVMTNQLRNMNDNYNKNIQGLSEQVRNLMTINAFYHEIVVYCDDRAKEIVLSSLAKLKIDLPEKSINSELENLKGMLKIKKYRLAGSAIYTI